MYDKYSYKIKFLFIYFVAVTIAISIIAFTFKLTNKNSVNTISIQHIQDVSEEKLLYLNEFINTYKATLNAITKDKNFNIYLNTNKNTSEIESYFLSIKRSLPYASQVRYIHMNGDEKIRIDSVPAKVVSSSKLQNKLNRYYVKEFLSLTKDKIGISNIDLNVEHGKVVIPKEPTVRIGKVVYGKDGLKKGIVVINIVLTPFFENLHHTELYNISIVDKKGNYLVHYDKKYGLLGENSNYTLKDEFPMQSEEILKNKSYLTKKVYSSAIEEFNNQGLKIIVTPKYAKMIKRNEDIQLDLIVTLLFIAFLFSPLIIYFAHLPDSLAKKFIEEHSTDNTTGFPNKLSLLDDLKAQKFHNHIIILIHINNIFRIQNTYGYKVSDKLIRLFTRFLAEYENVEKLYVKNYNSFALMYKYTNDNELKEFLNTLQNNLEKKQFTIDGKSVEFLLNTTMGVSNPQDLQSDEVKLQQAENALEMALDNHQNMDIYGTIHEKNLDSKRENINLAFNIKKYIEADKILVYYQPIFNNLTEKIEKYECLVRIQGDDGILYPDTFLPIAKEINQYNRLSYLIIQKAFDFFKDKEYEFSINLSIIDLYDVKFQEYLFEKIKEYKVQDRLVIEIVESESINNYEIFFDFAKNIKHIGCKIAIDDFGSGYSNFNYIIQLSEYIDYLKIDGSLVKGIVESHKIQILIGSLKFLSDNLEIKTIAEYVEDEEVLRYLSSIGVDYSQGYFIGKPQPELIKD